MPATVTENWSDRRYVRGTFGQRGWIVTGVANETAAIVGVNVHETGSKRDGPAAKNYGFILDSRLKAQEPEVERLGPATYHVVAVYEIPERQIDAEPDNPLDKPVQWLWEEGTVTEPTDIDAENRPIVDTAVMPFGQEPTTERELLYLVAIRNESQYDVRKNIAFRGRANRDRVMIPMAGMVEPGQMKLISYRPTQPYDHTSTYVECVYRFELGAGNVEDSDGLYDTFKHRILSQGYNGWFDNSGTKTKAPFCYSDGTLVRSPVLLAANGTPLDTTIKVLRSAATNATAAAVAPPNTISTSLLEVVRDAGNSAVTGVFLKYPKKAPANFSGLDLF